MTLHVGELTSQVDVQGVAGATAPPGGDKKPSPWEERERHRRLAEEERERRARVAGEGFDG